MILSIPLNPITNSLPRRVSLQRIYSPQIELAKYASRILLWAPSLVMVKHLKYLRMITPYGGSMETMQGLLARERVVELYNSMLGLNGLSEHLKTLNSIRLASSETSLHQETTTLKSRSTRANETFAVAYGTAPNIVHSLDYHILEERALRYARYCADASHASTRYLSQNLQGGAIKRLRPKDKHHSEIVRSILCGVHRARSDSDTDV